MSFTIALFLTGFLLHYFFFISLMDTEMLGFQPALGFSD